MLNLNTNLLYYTAIGDAYCLSTEYIKHPRDDELKAKALEFKGYLQHPVHKAKPGSYSDDTQMSIANAEVLIKSGPMGKIEDIDFANAWVEAFKRDPRDAYSRGFQAFLEEVKSGKEFLDKIVISSNKNGAAMRAAVFGVYEDVQKALDVSRQQASITHNTPGGIFGSQAVTLMSHFALHSDQEMNRLNLGEYIIEHLGDTLVSDDLFKDVIVTRWDGRVAGEEIGIITAWAVFELLVSCNSLLEIMQKTIEWGGDTDSVASIAMGIGSARLPDDLPKFMHSDLERNSKYGSKYLQKLGSQLMLKFS